MDGLGQAKLVDLFKKLELQVFVNYALVRVECRHLKVILGGVIRCVMGYYRNMENVTTNL